MARRFRRTRRGITAGLEPHEADLLAGLMTEVAQMLRTEEPAAAGPEASGGADEDPFAALARDLEGGRGQAPDDPALARLLPAASRDDEEAAADFRRFAQEGIAASKRGALERAVGTLRRPAPLLLDDDEARAWVTALTDVRLVLAQRLGLETDDDAALVGLRAAQADEDDPASQAAALYDFLTWLQEGLADVLLRDLPAGGGPPRR